MASKVERIVERLQAKISEGDYYEAQQQTRVAASRYVKTHNWPAAVDILSSVAQALLRAGQGGSGGDLCILLVDVYRQAEMKPDAATRGRLLACLRLFDAQEPTRKKFITEMMGWSAKLGEYPAGDPELHHVAGSLYAEEHNTYEAERHLVLGTKDSPEVLLRMEFDWYKEGEPHMAPHYAARAVLPYLLIGNVRAATACYRLFTAALAGDADHNKDKDNDDDDDKDNDKDKGGGAALGAQDVATSAGTELRVFPSLPLLNFLGLLLLAVQRGAPELFKGLVTKYAAHIGEAEVWREPLEMVGEMYFGIVKPRKSNPLMDMMSGFFGGPAGGMPQAPRRGLRGADGPNAEGLD